MTQHGKQLLTSTLCTGAIALFAGRAFPQQAETPGASLVCASNAGERQACPGDTLAGVALIKSTSAAIHEIS